MSMTMADEASLDLEIWRSVNAWRPARETYDKLAALMGEGALLHDLSQMIGHARLSPDRLKADALRRRENKTMRSRLAKLKACLDRRQAKAIEDMRAFNYVDLTFPVGFMAAIDDALAYFEGDQAHARAMTGVGRRSGGGKGERSQMSARFAAIGRFAEQVKVETGEPHDADVAVLAEALLKVGRSAKGQRAVTARDVEAWRLDFARKACAA